MQKTEETRPDSLRALRGLKVATGVVLFVAGFKLMVALAVLLTTTEAAQRPLDVRYEIAVGALFIVLGFLAWRQSALALVAAVALLTGEGVWSVIGALRQGGGGGDGSSIPLGGFALRLLLIFLMLRGIAAIRALKRSPASGAGAEG